MHHFKDPKIAFWIHFLFRMVLYKNEFAFSEEKKTSLNSLIIRKKSRSSTIQIINLVFFFVIDSKILYRLGSTLFMWILMFLPFFHLMISAIITYNLLKVFSIGILEVYSRFVPPFFFFFFVAQLHTGFSYIFLSFFDAFSFLTIPTAFSK